MEMKRIYEVNIFHDYFKAKFWNTELTPTPETVVLLSRRNVLFKQFGIGKWGLISENEHPFRADDNLFFTLKPLDPFYSYYTDLTPENKKYMEGIPFQLLGSQYSSPIGKASEMNLFFYSKTLYWEYIIGMSKVDSYTPYTLYMEDRVRKITFGRCEKIEFLGKPCFRFVSNEKIKLKQTYDSSLFLYEDKGLGRRILMRNLSAPVPGKFISGQRDCIQHYIYI